ncbi:hypothetical protein IAC76_03250, partial [Spirochaetes bacterium]|nr:hypothetical protein [Candidatus Scatousia excrementipullorum]
MDFSLHNNDNSKLNKIDIKIKDSWENLSKQHDNKLFNSVWQAVDNGDGIVQQNELDLMNKLLNIADNTIEQTKGNGIIDNNELQKLTEKIKDGSIKKELDNRLFGTVNADIIDEAENFSYIDKEQDVNTASMTPAQQRLYNRKIKGNNSFVVNVDYSNMDVEAGGEYYIEKYNRVKNKDGTYTETPVAHRKMTSGENRKTASWSEGLDRQISKITFAPTESETERAEQMKTIIDEVRTIGKEVGFEVEEIHMNSGWWLEDYGIRRADGKMVIPTESTAEFVESDKLNRKYSILDRKNISKSTQGNAAMYQQAFEKNVQDKDKVYSKSYLEGGNVLNTCLADGTPAAIIGDETIWYTLRAMQIDESEEENIELAKKQIAEDLGIAQENITFIPQYDFHIDMLYRPLHNGEIAVPDYAEGIKILKETNIKNMDDKTKQELITRLETLNEKSAGIREDAEQKLMEKGYKIVKIPSFDADNSLPINYMNGIGGTSPKGETFYITNKSDYPELNSKI